MDESCPVCPDAHPDPRDRTWSAELSHLHHDGEGFPTVLEVAAGDGVHISTDDVAWAKRMLSGSPGAALDELERLARPDQLGELLPGLGDVLEVLRAQIGQALMDKAEENERQRQREIEERHARKAAMFASLYGGTPGGPGGPPAAGGAAAASAGAYARGGVTWSGTATGRVTEFAVYSNADASITETLHRRMREMQIKDKDKLRYEMGSGA